MMNFILLVSMVYNTLECKNDYKYIELWYCLEIIIP